MDERAQIAAFENDLDDLVARYAAEFDVSAAAVCGVLMMKIRLIQDKAIEDDEIEQ